MFEAKNLSKSELTLIILKQQEIIKTCECALEAIISYAPKKLTAENAQDISILKHIAAHAQWNINHIRNE